MSGEAGPAPGLSTVAGVRPRPAATVSLRTWGWNEGLAVGCRQTWIPRSEGRASEAHRQGANAVANTQTAGRNKRRGCGPGRKWPDDHPPGEGPGRYGAPSDGNLPGHRPGSGRTLFGADCRSRTRARSNVGLRSRRPSPPCQRDVCSGTKRRTGRRKEPYKILRQVASGASSET
jgi:hypothetical protein